MTAGYRFETHKIVTEDNYINTAWRIVGRLNITNEPPPEKKPCVILQHGLLDNSATWLIPNATDAFPFMLVDEGYDVWMTNSRGNINSYEHMEPDTHSVYSPSSKYYDFTWDEMGKYDVPANLNYVLQHSEYDKAFYVGHSQGTTQFFVASDVIGGLGDKIAGFIGVGPVMYVGHMYSPFLRLLMATGILELLEMLKVYNFLLIPTYFSPLLRYVMIHMRHFVWRFIGLICGIDEVIRADLSRMPVMGNHEPGGSSLKNILHWTRNIQSGEFAYHDYGAKSENLKVYGQETPPLYNTTHIAEEFKKFPSYLMAGDNDCLVSKKDLAKLKAIVEPSGAIVEVLDTFAHLDYVWGKESRQKVFEPALEFIKKHTS